MREELEKMGKEQLSGKINTKERMADIFRTVIKEGEEGWDRKLKANLTIVEDALAEYLKGESEEKSPGKFVLGDVDKIMEVVERDFSEDPKDPTVALALLESGLYYVVESQLANEQKLKEADLEYSMRLKEEAEIAQALESRFSEAEDFFFLYSDVYGVLPERKDILEWTKNERTAIERGSKEAGTDLEKSIFESKLKTQSPVFERFLTGKQTLDDYNMAISAIEDRLQVYRDVIKDQLSDFFSTEDQRYLSEMRKNLKIVYTLRSFMAMLEGERNEKTALRK